MLQCQINFPLKLLYHTTGYSPSSSYKKRSFVMSLEECIRDIQSKLEKREYPDEREICKGVVERLLHEMGWNIFGTKVVSPQYPPKEGKVDKVNYALCVQKDKPVVFIEVKHPGNSEKTREGPEQISRYIHDGQVPFGVWTDGEGWYFYLSIGEGDCDELDMLDLMESDASESSSYLQRYLSFDKVSSGEALENVLQDYKNVLIERKARESISEAWGKLIEEKDKKLIEVVSEKVKGIRKFKPDQQQVISYLKSLKEKFGLSPILPQETRVVSREKKSFHNQKIRVTFPDGNVIQDHVVRDTFVKTIKAIGTKKVEALKMRVNSHPLVSKTPIQGKREERRFSWVAVDSGFYVNTRSGTEQKFNILTQINEKLELELKIELFQPE